MLKLFALSVVLFQLLSPAMGSAGAGGAGGGGAPRPLAISQFSTYSLSRIPGIVLTPLPRSWDDFVVRWMSESSFHTRVAILKSLFGDGHLDQPFATVRDDVRAALRVPLYAGRLESDAWQEALTALTTGEGKLAKHTLAVTQTRFRYMLQTLILDERLERAFRPEESDLANHIIYNLVRGFDLTKAVKEAQTALPAYKSVFAESITRHMVEGRLSWAEARLRALEGIGADLPPVLQGECRRRIAAGESVDEVMSAMYAERLFMNLRGEERRLTHMSDEELRVIATQLLRNDEMRTRRPTFEEIRHAIRDILIERGIAFENRDALECGVDFVLTPVLTERYAGGGAAAGEVHVMQPLLEKIRILKTILTRVAPAHQGASLIRYMAIIESNPSLASLEDDNLHELLQGIQTGIESRGHWGPLSAPEAEGHVGISAAAGNVWGAWRRLLVETYDDPITLGQEIRGRSLIPFLGQSRDARHAALQNFARIFRREHEKKLGFPVLTDDVRFRWNAIVRREQRDDIPQSTKALLNLALGHINEMINPHDGNIRCDGARVGVMLAALNPDDDAPLALKLPFGANPLSLKTGVDARIPHDPTDEQVVALFGRVRDWSMPEVAGTRSVRAGFWESLSDPDHGSFAMGFDAERRVRTVKLYLTRAFCWIINERERLVPVGDELSGNLGVHINPDADARRIQRKLFFRRFQALFPDVAPAIAIADEERSMALVQVMRGASHCDDGVTEGINAVCALPPEHGDERSVEDIIWQDIIAGVHARVRSLAESEHAGDEAVESVLYLQQALKDILGLPIQRGWGIFSGGSIFSRSSGASVSTHLKGLAGLDAMMRTVRRLRETYLNPEALIGRVISLSHAQPFELGSNPIGIYTTDLERWLRAYPPLSNHDVYELFGEGTQITRETAIHLLVNIGILQARTNPWGALTPTDWELTVHGNLEDGFRVVATDLPCAVLDDRSYESFSRQLVRLLRNPHEPAPAARPLLPLDAIYATRLAVRAYADYRRPESFTSSDALMEELTIARGSALETLDNLRLIGADLHAAQERLRILGVEEEPVGPEYHPHFDPAAGLAFGGGAPVVEEVVEVLADFADQADRDALIARARAVADTAERQAARDAILRHADAGHAWAVPVAEELFA